MKKKFFVGISVILLLAIFVGSTGISLQFHTCHSSNRIDILAFPEFMPQSGECCDGDCACSGTQSISDLSFNSVECCITSHLYLKFSYTCYVVNPAPFNASNPFCLYILHDNIALDPQTEPIPGCYHATDHSPPLMSGKTLVHFIHQLRIPTPGS